MLEVPADTSVTGPGSGGTPLRRSFARLSSTAQDEQREMEWPSDIEDGNQATLTLPSRSARNPFYLSSDEEQESYLAPRRAAEEHADDSRRGAVDEDEDEDEDDSASDSEPGDPLSESQVFHRGARQAREDPMAHLRAALMARRMQMSRQVQREARAASDDESEIDAWESAHDAAEEQSASSAGSESDW